jgi:Zn-dependent oligopeptidase
MAKSEENINKFHESIIEKALPKAKEEYNKLFKFANEYEKENKRNKIDTLELWDMSYYSDKLKKKLYDIDSEQLRKYFPLNKVFEKLFNLIYDLFEIKIVKEENIKLFHNDIITFSM